MSKQQCVAAAADCICSVFLIEFLYVVVTGEVALCVTVRPTCAFFYKLMNNSLYCLWQLLIRCIFDFSARRQTSDPPSWSAGSIVLCCFVNDLSAHEPVLHLMLVVVGIGSKDKKYSYQLQFKVMKMEPFRIHIIPGNHRHLKSVCVKSNWWKLKLALQNIKIQWSHCCSWCVDASIVTEYWNWSIF